jgi:hypothetical protein
MKKVISILKDIGAVVTVIYMLLSSNHFFSPTAVKLLDNTILLVVFFLCIGRIIRMIEKI